MKNRLLKLLMVIAPIILCFSVVSILEQVDFNKKGQIFESEQDFKLKFVDSTDYELGLSGITKVILPFEVLSVEEKQGFIVIKTYENSVVFSPVDCVVASVSGETGEIELKAGNIKVLLTGVISGVKVGNSIACGDVIGTVKGDSCAIQVYWGTRKLSLAELRAVL